MPTCPYCGKSFETERGLKIHVARVHGKKERRETQRMGPSLLEFMSSPASE